MTTAVVDIYCRHATMGQADTIEDAVAAQEAACRAYCEEHGLAIGLVHREIASGMSYRERKQLGLMRRRYRNGEIQGVVVASLDRLSRSQDHLSILMEEMEAHGITLHCTRKAIADTPMGKFIQMAVQLVTDAEQKKSLDTPLTKPER